MAQFTNGSAGPNDRGARSSPTSENTRAGPRLVASREPDEAAWRAARREVLRRIEAQGAVPRAVREMLEDGWAHALARVRSREGPGSAAWFNLLKAMDDLLWSVQPKMSTDERKRLMGVLPALIAELQEGMILGQWSSDRRDLFLSALVDFHAEAVKAGFKRGGPKLEIDQG